MNTPNARIFSIEELKFKPYGLLMNSLNTFIEVASELEEYIEEMEELEIEQGFLDSETHAEVNLVSTQLDYLYQNIKTTIDAMKYKEDKAFFKVTNLPLVCVN